MEMKCIVVIILISSKMVVNGGMMGQKCQTQLFGNRCSAWELFWVVSLSSGSTVADLNWAASCVNCELNWIGVASQLNRAHSEQGGERPPGTPCLSSFQLNPTRESRSIPTLRNAFEMCGERPLGAKAATPPFTATINLAPPRPPFHIERPPYPILYKSPYTLHCTSLPYQAGSGAAFLWKTIALPLTWRSSFWGKQCPGNLRTLKCPADPEQIRIGSLRRPPCPSFPSIWGSTCPS